jgi:large subunit ribosomal protein L18
MRTQKKHQLRQLRVWRLRKKVVGTGERPRMSVRFTGAHIYVQFIDDSKGITLASSSTRTKSPATAAAGLGANVKSAVAVGRNAAEVAKAKGISAVVFDRAGARYHGKVKALADAAREGGLQF